MWKPVFTSGMKTRLLTSRLILKANTRVMSAWNASTCRSIISLTCSSYESGTPFGAPGSSRASPLLFFSSTFWMRRSISRTSSRYSFRRARSAAPRSFWRRATELCTKSSRLLSRLRRAARASGVAPIPNNWSKTSRGSRIIGSGSVGDAQLIESV